MAGSASILFFLYFLINFYYKINEILIISSYIKRKTQKHNLKAFISAYKRRCLPKKENKKMGDRY